MRFPPPLLNRENHSGMNGAAFFCFGAGQGGAGDIFFGAGRGTIIIRDTLYDVNISAALLSPYKEKAYKYGFMTIFC